MPRVRFSSVGPPTFAISSTNELLSPILDWLAFGFRRAERLAELKLKHKLEIHTDTASFDEIIEKGFLPFLDICLGIEVGVQFAFAGLRAQSYKRTF